MKNNAPKKSIQSPAAPQLCRRRSHMRVWICAILIGLGLHTTSLVLMVQSAHAAPIDENNNDSPKNDAGEPPVPPSRALVIKKINVQEIVDTLNDAKSPTLSVRERIDAIHHVSKFPYKEVVAGLLDALQTETRKPTHEMRYLLLYHLIGAIGECAIDKDFPRYVQILTGFDNYLKTLGDDQKAALFSQVTTTKDKMLERKTELDSLPKILEKRRSDIAKQSLKDELADFRVHVEEDLKGQPHVVEKLVQLRSRDLFYGFRDNPPFIWFLGPPGTGKDTAVRAYAKASNYNSYDDIDSKIYRVNPLKSEQDLSALLGSGTGFIGSESVPGIIKFLVNCSGGKYEIEEIPGAARGGGSTYKINLNKQWRPGDLVSGYSSPENCIVYLDEFHDWSYTLKNDVVKKAVEYGGYWQIKNPNGGETQIYVPVTIVAASNDGIELVTSRESNGQRFGKPLSYPQMKQKADRIRGDATALRNSILNRNEPSHKQNAKGTSEELLNRVPEDYLVYFDPLSPEQLKEIAESKLKKLRANIGRSQRGYNQINLVWTPAVVDLIQEYHYVAEDQARPIENRVRSMIEETIIRAAANDLLIPNSKTNVKIDVLRNRDNTWSMQFEVNGLVQGAANETQLFDLPITQTLGDQDRMPISDEQIDALTKIEPALRAGVIGQTHALSKIARKILLTAEGRAANLTNDEATEKARSFMALGPTSTGKTETAKVLAEILLQDRSAAVTIDCTNIRNIEKMHLMFFGNKDEQGNVTPSDFMKHYDRNNGRLVVALDEAANAPPEVLNALFDLLREPEVSTFKDGKRRKMGNVIFLITGNASQEILKQLPHDLPEDVLREVWADIYDQLETDPFFRRQILDRYFTPPFIARVGDENIFFYKPLNYAEVRLLTQMKLEQLIDKLEPTTTKRGWSVRFANRTTYMKVLEALEDHGFKVQEQGASIDNYVMEVFGAELRATLFLNKVPHKDHVTVELEKIASTAKGTTAARHKLHFKITTAGGQTLRFNIDGKAIQNVPEKLKRDQLLTAAHESGHMIVGLSLLSDFRMPVHVRILPGVGEINGEWVYYAGVASSQIKIEPKVSLEYVLREVAVLLAGTVAESLVVQGGIDTAGRSNDIKRANAFLEDAILKWGMSERFGKIVRNKEELSSRERAILRDEVLRFMKVAEDLAKKAILANGQSFVGLTNKLAAHGILETRAINQIIQKNGGLVREDDSRFEQNAMANARVFNSTRNTNRVGVKYNFVDQINLIDINQVGDIKAIVAKKKRKQLAEAILPDNLSIVGRPERNNGSGCAQILK